MRSFSNPQKKAVRQLLDGLSDALVACVFDREQIPTFSARLSLSEQTIRDLVNALEEPSTQRELPVSLVAEFTQRGDFRRKIEQSTQKSPSKTKGLDLGFNKPNKFGILAIDNPTIDARATAKGLELLHHLTEIKLGNLSAGDLIQTVETVAEAGLEHDSVTMNLVENALEDSAPESLATTLRKVNVLRRAATESAAAYLEARPSDISHDVRQESSKAVGSMFTLDRTLSELALTLVQTVYGNPFLVHELELAFDSLAKMSTRTDAKVAFSSDDLLVFALKRSEELIQQLSTASGLEIMHIKRILTAIAEYPPTAFRELRWLLLKGEPSESRVGKGVPVPDYLDTAWSVLWQFAGQYSLAEKLPKGIRYSSLAQLPRLLMTAVEAVSSQTALAERHRVDLAKAAQGGLQLLLDAQRFSVSHALPCLLAIRQVVKTESARNNSRLALLVVSDVLQLEGNLSWQRCLALANQRSRSLKYHDAHDRPLELQVEFQLPPRSSSTLSVAYSAKQQPLSIAFPIWFEPLAPEHKILALWRLVIYASDSRADYLSVGSREIGNQFDRRERDLWKFVQSSPDRHEP